MDFNGQLFNSEKGDIADQQYVKTLAEKNGFDGAKLQNCVADNKTKEIIKRQFEQVQLTGVYGTPTIFINGKALVGPKPYRVYKGMINKP